MTQAKRLAILGSTGSIGTQTIDVVSANPHSFDVAALACRSNVELLRQQVDAVRPEVIGVVDKDAAAAARDWLPRGVRLVAGEEGLAEIAALDGVDLVVNAVVGAAGLWPTLAAIGVGNDVALANKESLVCAGELVKVALAQSSSRIIPIDSEHSALFQCLVGEAADSVRALVLTASGGPFMARERQTLAGVTPAEALAHPRWDMGARVTIDSATLMNKGFEVIEARFLFELPYEKIDVVLHPESIVHSMIEFVDGSIKAQLGPPDMRIPIQYALSWPARLPADFTPFSLATAAKLHFQAVEPGRWPCFDLARDAARAGQTVPAVLNAADEVAVGGFLASRIGFVDIGEIVGAVLERHQPQRLSSLETFAEVDAWARAEAAGLIADKEKVAH